MSILFYLIGHLVMIKLQFPLLILTERPFCQGLGSKVCSLDRCIVFVLFRTVRYKMSFFFPENGDDNMIMGLCIDMVSVEGTVNVRSGDDELKELPPFCVLVCLTLEGKLVMYNVAR